LQTREPRGAAYQAETPLTEDRAFHRADGDRNFFNRFKG
jgi:hypothetical protein